MPSPAHSLHVASVLTFLLLPLVHTVPSNRKWSLDVSDSQTAMLEALGRVVVPDTEQGVQCRICSLVHMHSEEGEQASGTLGIE